MKQLIASYEQQLDDFAKQSADELNCLAYFVIEGFEGNVDTYLLQLLGSLVREHGISASRLYRDAQKGLLQVKCMDWPGFRWFRLLREEQIKPHSISALSKMVRRIQGPLQFVVKGHGWNLAH